MRCSFCSYSHKPDNPQLLRAHAELDIIEGRTNNSIPVVVWRDGEFWLIEKAKDGEAIFPIGIIDPRPAEESEEELEKRRAYDALVTIEEEEEKKEE
jgi:hypothetical protein